MTLAMVAACASARSTDDEATAVELLAPTAAVQLGPELAIGATVIGPKSTPQSWPTAAVADDGSFLVVWTEPRGGIEMIVASRVTATGAILDPGGLLLGYGVEPSVAFGGGVFAVTWTTGTGIAIRRVSTAGALLDAAPVGISGMGAAFGATIASSGARFLVAVAPTSGAVLGALVEPAGAPGAAFTLDKNGALSGLRLAGDGAGFGAIWYDGIAVRGRTVSGTGVPSATSFGLGVGAGVSSSGFAFAGGAYVAITYDSATSQSTLTQISPSGVVLGSHTIENGTALTANGAGLATVRASPWGVVSLAHLDATGMSLGTDVALPHSGGAVALACGGGRCLAAMTPAGPMTSNDLWIETISDAGVIEPAGGVVVATGANVETAPKVASNGSVRLSAWIDSRDGAPRLYANRTSVAGVALDPADVAIADGPVSLSSVVSDGDGWLLVYTDTGGLHARHVSATGTIDAPLTLDSSGAAAAVFDGTTYFVVWSTEWEVRAARVSRDGATADATLVLVQVHYPMQPAVAYNRHGFVVAFEAHESGDPFALRAVRVDPTGQPIVGWTVATNAQGGTFVGEPSVAADDDGWLVTYNASYGIYARPISFPATLQPQVTIAADPDARQGPRAIFDGYRYLVAWTRMPPAMALVPHVEGAWLDAANQPSAPIAIASGTDTLLFDLAPGEAGGLIAAYTRFDDTAGVEADRVRERTIAFAAAHGTGCSVGDECTSGLCVDGVCCATACPGGDTDCQACSVAAGAAVDGVCGPVIGAHACDDGDACTTGDTCAAGACSPGAPAITFAPSPIAFAGTPVGTTGALDVTIGNTSGHDLPLSAVAASGDGFTVLHDPSPVTIAAGATVVVQLGFAPTATGDHTGALTLTIGGCAPVAATLTGAGTRGALAIAPAAHDFGEVDVAGPAVEQTFVATNTGDATLHVTTIDLGASNSFAMADAPVLPVAITPGATLSIRVRALPAAAEPVAATLTVTTDVAGDPPHTVALTATGRCAACGVDGGTTGGQDARPGDAGMASDAAVEPDASGGGGCGCRSTEGGGATPALAALVLLVVLRRPRARRS